MFNNLEDLVLFIFAVPILLNGYFLGCILLARQYFDWRIEKSKLLKVACKDTCMCGDSIDSHNAYNSNHSPLSEFDWASKNLPKLKMG